MWDRFRVSPPAANRHGVGRALVPRPDQERLLNLFVTTSVGPSAMLITGEAGIGKSTLCGIGIASAVGAGQTVLSTRTAQSEAELSFAGLADLLDRVDESVFAELSDGQREALDAALLRGGGSTAPNPRSIGAALLAVLRTLAARAPVLIAIDDVQWLDSASTDALSFALRRLSDEPVRVLCSVRTFSALAPYADSGGDAVTALPAALPATTHSGTANAAGHADIPFDIANATHGYRVVVNVSVRSRTDAGTCSTSFTTR